MLLMASRHVTYRLLVVLSAWFLVGGVAWTDLCDLNDELQPLPTGMTQVIEPDVDEIKHGAVEADPFSRLPGQAPALVPLRRPPSAVSTQALSKRSECPLYQRLSTYRI